MDDAQRDELKLISKRMAGLSNGEPHGGDLHCGMKNS